MYDVFDFFFVQFTKSKKSELVCEMVFCSSCISVIPIIYLYLIQKNFVQ